MRWEARTFESLISISRRKRSLIHWQTPIRRRDSRPAQTTYEHDVLQSKEANHSGVLPKDIRFNQLDFSD
jgi:hypothetical protein